jgi:biotin transport system substrate-specific component
MLSNVKNFVNNPSILSTIIVSFIGSIYLALSSQVSIMLNPVPITLQTFALITLGLFLGPKKAVLSVIMFLTEGALGLPVFAGAKFGLPVLFGPTAGFLFGFLPYVFLYGIMRNKILQNNYFKAILLGLIAEITLFSFGLAWLGLYMGYNKALLLAGLIPFIPGSIIKASLGVSAFKLANNLYSKK